MANDLPPEILRLIVSELELKERIKQRLVCRKWKAVIESLKVDELSVVDSKFATRTLQFVDLKFINYRNLIHYPEPRFISFDQLLSNIRSPFGMKKKEARSLVFDPKNPIFSRLRRLFVLVRTMENFNFEEYINCQFEHLEELSFSLHQFGTSTCLKLANLRVLSMQNVKTTENTAITLNLPKLEKFATLSKIQCFTFLHPQSLLYLTVAEDHESIAQFTNLRVLSCMKYRNPSAIFSNMPKLKEIHFESLELIRNINTEAIFRAKQGLGRSDLKMVVLGLDFEDYRRLNLNVEQVAKNLNEFIVTNYPNLGSWEALSLYWNAHYDKLVGLFAKGIPCDFTLKFPSLKSMYVTKIESDVLLFFRFLKIYPNLCRLNLTETFDGLADYQKWYDLLPDYCERLQTLIIRSELSAESGDSSLEPSFLLKLKFLQSFKTNLNISGTFALSMWRALRYFKSQELIGKLRVQRHQHYSARGYFDVTLPTGKVLTISYSELKNLFVVRFGLVKEFAANHSVNSSSIQPTE